jgi:DNA excision repair protein ERCC-3
LTDGPLIVQSDKTLLLEVDHEQADACRKAIAPFAELERAPEHVHTYRLTPLGCGTRAPRATTPSRSSTRCCATAATPSRTRCSSTSRRRWRGTAGCACSPTRRTARARVQRPSGPRGGAAVEEGRPARRRRVDADTVVVHPSERGTLKQVLLKLGWPAEDLAGYVDGEAHTIGLREDGWSLRPYQREAVDGFWHGGSGVVVLPCGAGKTLVGAAAMAEAQATTLILVTNTVAARQWRSELLKRTTLTDDEIGEYSGAKKEIRPVTIATYQVMTTRRKGVYAHLELFDSRDWGLIVYDEVHLLPAPIFRFTATSSRAAGSGSPRRWSARTAARATSSR